MTTVPHVATLSDYLRIAEQAIVIESPLADDLESALLFSDGQWFLLVNPAAVEAIGELHSQSESS